MAHSRPLFIEPVFVRKLWGGSRLQPYTTTPLPGSRIGECLAISAHPDHDCVVRDGVFAGRRLSQLWDEHRDLFGNASPERLPLQVKLIDATQDLSVQVHPGEQHASRDTFSEAKHECWYVLTPSTSGRVILGHHASSVDEFASLAQRQRWSDVMRWVEMGEGDLFDIPPGTAHCLLAGSIVYEVLQTSSTTYRLYDHERVDANGVPRELHLERGLEVLSAPDRPLPTVPTIRSQPGLTETLLVRNDHFGVRRYDVSGEANVAMDAPYYLASVLDGAGMVNGAPVATGDHFVVPHGRLLSLAGSFNMMLTSP